MGFWLVLLIIFIVGIVAGHKKQAAQEQKEEEAEVLGPKVEKVLSGEERIAAVPDAYPQWMLDFYDTHREAADWVADYPDYAKLSEDAINKKALQPVELKKYKVVNGIPLFIQWDKQWGYASYGNGVIGIEGCGPTCLSMVAVALKQDVSLTPKWMADFSQENGYYLEDTGTDWNLMEYGAEKLGIRSQQIMQWTESALKNELQAGRPMICSMGPGDFTNTGHFIVLAGIAEDGRIIVNDPNSPVNSDKLWDAQTLLDQMKAMWSFWIE